MTSPASPIVGHLGKLRGAWKLCRRFWAADGLFLSWMRVAVAWPYRDSSVLLPLCLDDLRIETLDLFTAWVSITVEVHLAETD